MLMADYGKALPKGTRITAGDLYDYVIDSVLGQGGFGITYLAMATPKRGGAAMKVALKEFFMNNGDSVNARAGLAVTAGTTSQSFFQRYRRKFTNEADKLRSLSNGHIIKVYEPFDANGTSYYSMEYMSNGNFEKYISSHGPLTEERALHFARQIADGLGYMHAHNMLHLDLKPGNIMMKDDDNLVIIDFGLSKIVSDDGRAESSSIVSGLSRYYAPPEQSSFRFAEGAFPATLDIYPVGAILFKMLTNELPPDDILNDGFPHASIKASKEMVALVEHAMKPRYKERIQNVGELVKRLESLPISKRKSESSTLISEPPTRLVTLAPYCIYCGYRFQTDEHRYCVVCGNKRMQYK